MREFLCIFACGLPGNFASVKLNPILWLFCAVKQNCVSGNTRGRWRHGLSVGYSWFNFWGENEEWEMKNSWEEFWVYYILIFSLKTVFASMIQKTHSLWPWTAMPRKNRVLFVPAAACHEAWTGSVYGSYLDAAVWPGESYWTSLTWCVHPWNGSDDNNTSGCHKVYVW